MKLQDILNIGVIVIAGYFVYENHTRRPVTALEVVDNSSQIDSLIKNIKALEERLDPIVNKRIDHILNKEYEGFENCIDTIWNDGVIEYHWNGCN